MTDKELLEFAAKAAELTLANQKDDDVQLEQYCKKAHKLENGEFWNPLTDDGDALRLAVKLKIEFYIAESEGFASYAGYPYTNGTIRYASEWHDDSSPEEATRRAIVRAAAEIGKTLG